MMTKHLLLLAALTLCCCIASLDAYARRCHCIRTTSTPVPNRAIAKIEVFPISGNCRRTEIIVTRKKGSKVCVNPNVQWINNLLKDVRRNNVTSATDSPTATTATTATD